ncbi:MAG: hypothetical protein NZ518_07870, partial [Dehalococcoidia bacterium]|nr:hypothetical protein [Dehalococcoidia bacterium]
MVALIVGVAIGAPHAWPSGADAQQGQASRLWTPLASRNASVSGDAAPPVPGAAGQWRRVTPPTST